MKYYSADSTSSMGQTVSLVSRVIDSENNIIVETITQPKENQVGADEFVTALKLKDRNTFTASDSANTFSGEITFFGDAWSWQSWDYDLTLKSGGTITGSGFLSPAGILTSKDLKTGNFEMKIIEDLKVISEAEYLTLRKTLSGN